MRATSSTSRNTSGNRGTSLPKRSVQMNTFGAAATARIHITWESKAYVVHLAQWRGRSGEVGSAGWQGRVPLLMLAAVTVVVAVGSGNRARSTPFCRKEGMRSHTLCGTAAIVIMIDWVR